MPAFAPSLESMSLSSEAQKANLIESMIRVAPTEQTTEQLITSLSHLPLEALERLSAYGTKFEIFDKNADDLPLYARHLQKPNLDGAYSPTANIVFLDQENITPRILVHESLHALDMATGQQSSTPLWGKARDLARSTQNAIRPYATHNPSEYFADNLAASLFARDTMNQLVSHDWSHNIGVGVQSFKQLHESHSHYHREGQSEVDPVGAKLCKKFWEALPQLKAAPPRPAMSPAEYRTHLERLLAAKKAAG